jgi:hypothetical protein
MKTALRRTLSIADEIDSFEWSGPDLDRIFFSVNRLRSMAIRLRASAKRLNQSWLQDALEKLPLSIDGNDLDGGLLLEAELVSVAGFLRDAVEEWGDDPSHWPSPAQSVNPALGKPEEKPLHPKERESLLTLVIGMAMACYKYEPSASKSSVPKFRSSPI